MLYRVDILDRTFTPLTTILTPFVFGLSYSREINRAGSAEFSIKVSDPRATAANLKLFNRIKIYKGTKFEFIGYIETLHVNLNIVTVQCIGMLGFFENRLFGGNKSAVNAGTALFDILNSTNVADNTGVTSGNTNIAATINNMTFSRSSVLAAFQKLANFAKGELQVNEDATLDFLAEIGTDKSGSIIFQYIATQINTATLFGFEVELTGKDMANKVIGIKNGGGTASVTDATSVTDFGMLESAQNFSETYDLADLTDEVQNYVDNHKNEFYSPTIKVNTEKIDMDSFDVGDTVKVVLNNGFILISQNHRIVQKSVRVSDNSTPEVDVKLIPVGSNLLPSSFGQSILDLQRRINLLEGNI